MSCFRLILVMLMTQMWLWSPVAQGQCDSSVEACIKSNETDTVFMVSYNDNKASGNPNRCIERLFTIDSHGITFIMCGAFIKTDGTLSEQRCQQISSICLTTTPPPTCDEPCTTQSSKLSTAPSTTPPTITTPECSAIAGSLGTMVGLLLALLALTNIGWVCGTCYIMNKKGKIIKQLNARLNGINQISNPQYGEDMSTSWHQNASLIPTYETIPDRQTAVNTTELKEHSYDVLHEAMPKTIHRDAKDQRRNGEKESSIESSSRYTLKQTQAEERDQGRVEMGKSGYDVRYSRGQTETEEGIKRDRTNTDQGKCAAKLSKEEDSAGHSNCKSITEGIQNGETESTTSEHNYFCLEESVKVNSDDHQQGNCDMEREGHRRDSAPPRGATARDYEDFVPSK